MSVDLDSLLEDVEWQKEVTVRRYLIDLVDFSETKLSERPDSAVGRVQFNPGDIEGDGMSKKYGRVAKFLSEDLGYIDEFTNYHIDPERIQVIREEAEGIELYPTTEEEQEMIQQILGDEELEFNQIRDELADRINYEPTNTMVKQRLEKIDGIEYTNGSYKLSS